MSELNFPLIESFFSGTKGQPGQSMVFQWRVIRRKGQPLLLLANNSEVTRGLNLYSPQRWQARLWCSILPSIMKSPAAGLFERSSFSADPSSEIMKFMAEQAGMPAGEIRMLAIKLSEVGSRMRMVVLLGDEAGRPTRVIKAGLNDPGRRAIKQEADFLEKLPANKLGCIRLSGRITGSDIVAFATDFFPGVSPRDDAGMEHLFHAWLKHDQTVPIESILHWRLLSAAADGDQRYWPHLQSILAGKKIRPTLYHGDFAPWNLRVLSAQNLQAFDWETGSLDGIPGWDWFHFIVQTSILARRYSIARTAAELEQLIESPRFKRYAEEAGILEITCPLALAYLLYQIVVVKPNDGLETTKDLLELLSFHWMLKTEKIEEISITPSTLPAPPQNVLAQAKAQLMSVGGMWNNLFWQPGLNFNAVPPLFADLRRRWLIAFLNLMLMPAIASVEYASSINIMFLPFHMLNCIIASRYVNRRWGTLVAFLEAPVGPLILAIKVPAWRSPEVILWNTIMRLLILQTCVLFANRVVPQAVFFKPKPAAIKPGKLADAWAVLVASILCLMVIVYLDYVTDPRITFVPVYIFPCMCITLTLGLRWGIIITLLAAFAGVTVERLTTLHYTAEDLSWNFIMRTVVYMLLLFLADRFRRESVLFIQRKPN